MRDRTRELRQASGSSSEGDEAEDGDKEALMKLNPLLQAGRVRTALRALEQELQALEQLQEEALGSPLPPDGQQRDLQLHRDEIQELTQEIRSRLRALELAKEEEEGDNRTSIRARVRRTQHAVLTQQFLALTGRCHAAQAQFRQRRLERVQRQLHVAGSAPVTEEELEQILESGHSEIFVSNVPGASRALQDLGQRHRELQRLERGLRDLGELFTALGTSLEQQGELLDRIEHHIQDSGARLDKGTRQLEAARRSQQGSRKKKLLLAGCVLMVAVIVAIIIAVAVATA
ncbi:syntaxin-4-like isoform X1 [Melopsittacus undulatus]|uniref:syntaxin-4-like isoform X1 n=1 Tax=Melopsittacus undulatus TaxID=13146 RepID=UPI00146C4C4E|nr:syntaxin-4-like isoform X1 [Melopsittacus undulatus]